MTKKTKLLTTVAGVIDSQDERGVTNEELAQEVIDTVANWFEDVLKNVGMQPTVIPTLLRWQAHQHKYLEED
jgi:hypothetical protein